MKNLLLILCFFPMLVLAQEEDQSKYMVGAVPEVNGKVVFSQEINAPNLSKDQIFDAILAWANTRFKTDKGNWGMVAYSNKEEGQIACYGNEYIVFADKTFSLDRAKINYRMNFVCTCAPCRRTSRRRASWHRISRPPPWWPRGSPPTDSWRGRRG